jgi:hypothetical protein
MYAAPARPSVKAGQNQEHRPTGSGDFVVGNIRDNMGENVEFRIANLEQAPA